MKKPQHILTKSRYSIGNNYYSCLNSKVRWLKSDIKADNRAFKKAHTTSSFLKSVYLLDFVCFFKLWLLYMWISHWSIQFTWYMTAQINTDVHLTHVQNTNKSQLGLVSKTPEVLSFTFQIFYPEHTISFLSSAQRVYFRANVMELNDEKKLIFFCCSQRNMLRLCFDASSG